MKKDILALGFVVLIVAVLVSGTKFQTVDEYYLTHIDDITEESETVFISIDCVTVLDNWDKLDPDLRFDEFVPPDGIVLPLTEYVLRPGDTAFDLLDRATRYNKIQMEYTGAHLAAYNSVYIEGIHYLYEFSCGPYSGWMYEVNGAIPMYGCSNYLLKDGDILRWRYTCDLGRDVGDRYRAAA